ncbi:MAG: hypothetical protein ABI867_08165 [Kofleriaceae bacterium]
MSRPRPKTRLSIDIENAYARLGASPLATTDEIKKLLSEKRGKAMAARRAKGQGAFGEEEQEIIELQAIEKQIGDPRARARYDHEHPQNALLTVQPAPRDRSLEPAGITGLATAWLLDELGAEALLLHPDAYWLWLPSGIDPELVAQLAPYTRADAAPARVSVLPELADLGTE